ncbi:MAG: agmatine deiminase family protein [Alphaproteobacteria bacterium]|nr:agmatine deiminase family protein [Alphaproteobacteria bacterium]
MINKTTTPPEWAPHKAIWTAWPSAADLWGADLEPAREEIAAMVKLLAEGDAMKVLVCGDEAEASARQTLGNAAEIFAVDFGDIWLRDTGPVFSRRTDGSLQAEIFQFNGWGEKYVLEHDDEVGAAIAILAAVPPRKHDFILEGGAVEADGHGTVLTTRQCLLNPNRNKGWTEAKAESALATAYGARKVIWLDEGLLNDHTDGHIDNLARFVAQGRVVCQLPSGKNDPNAKILGDIHAALQAATDADGRKLDVIAIPGPGAVLNDDDEPTAASHMNFIIGNKTVVVPVYNEYGEAAVAALAKLFPTRQVIGVLSRAVLTGGGSFHCITQQEPA